MKNEGRANVDYFLSVTERDGEHEPGVGVTGREGGGGGGPGVQAGLHLGKG